MPEMVKRVLIVDDVREYLEALRRALAPRYEVLTARTVGEAKALLSESIDLALVDVRLSEKDPSNREGIEFLSFMRESRPALPVIVMSAYRDYDAVVEALNLGARAYVKKPVVLADLERLIELHLTSRGNP